MLPSGTHSCCTTSPLRSYVMLTKLSPRGEGPTRTPSAMSHGPRVLHGVPWRKKRQAGLRDRQWEWFFGKKGRVLALKLTQHRSKQTETHLES